ncbi:hypothetical protein OS493_034716 [Desmophyllum pertusum]|uniref:PLAC8 family protein n=1 Tax=Desmophyllum pertusum TaxID=174260 RepID=A0A9X0CWW9_9CNID|nr:hypothetical protein OS493_034716 [Desmophyllum pertusum]
MAQVVTAQPGTTVVVQQTHVQRDWNSGVFGCFGDIGSCIMGLCCPCLQLCNISSRMGEGFLYGLLLCRDRSIHTQGQAESRDSILQALSATMPFLDCSAPPVFCARWTASSKLAASKVLQCSVLARERMLCSFIVLSLIWRFTLDCFYFSARN